MPAPDEDELLDPSLPICDAHHHLWDHRGVYLLDEFLADAGCGHDVRASVYVEGHMGYAAAGPEALRPAGETAFADRLASEALASGRLTRVAAAIVGCADLTLGDDVAQVLDAHVAASPARFRGIRAPLTWDADARARGSARAPGRMATAAFRAGFAQLVRRELTFDAWLFHPQLPELPPLLDAFPEARVVLNHAGGPLGVGAYATDRDGVFEQWHRAIAEIARRPNVVVKLGGFGMPRMGFGWEGRPSPPRAAEVAAAIAPWCTACIELFGPARCLFGSNFPPDRASFPYRTAWNAYKLATAGFTRAERRAMFHDNAVRFYRIEGARDASR